MNGFLLAVPVILIRYGLLPVMSRDGLKRANYSPPVKGNEVTAYWVYMITNIALFISLFFFTIHFQSDYFVFGVIIYVSGMILYAVSIIDFARPSKTCIRIHGLYKVSRNPMYVSYFIYFIGCSILTMSWLLAAILIIFQISVHWIILFEERWCISKYGVEYLKYKSKVRRYI